MEKCDPFSRERPSLETDTNMTKLLDSIVKDFKTYINHI